MRSRSIRSERGIALLTTLLVIIAVGAITLAAVMMTLNANLVTKNGERISNVDAAAVAGLEEARSRLNGNKTLYPTSGYTTLESNAAVKDAGNTAVPKVTRSTYIGPSGMISGQYGIVGSLISIARDSFGNRAVRRLEVNQESFSKFAYFTNDERDTSGTLLSFMNGDVIQGPVHSNDTINVASSGATFTGQVTTAASVINGQSNGTFSKPPQKSVTRIPMPTVADLNKLDSLANVGGTKFTGSTAGGTGEARTRIEFLTINLGTTYGVQGFFRVYQGTNEDFTSASLPASPYLETSYNCGDVSGGVFLAAINHTNTTAAPHNHNTTSTAANRDASLGLASSRCYLGGDSILTTSAASGTSAGAAWPTATYPYAGAWVQPNGTIQAAVNALDSVSGRPDHNYLFPLNRQWNPSFKGVISVAGKVIVSGVIHGRFTLAATGNIIFGDDVTYYQGSVRDCTTGDIAGWFSGQSVIVANNTVNAPQTVNTNGSISGSTTTTTGWRTYDDTRDETVYGFMLTLKTFGGESYNVGNMALEPCGSNTVGRGCLYTFGGIIQGNRGAVTQGGSGGATGYAKRYAYDACGATDPPPYYPTTGFFVKNRFYEIDPAHFDVAGWYAANQN
jgi:hypothetical protein